MILKRTNKKEKPAQKGRKKNWKGLFHRCQNMSPKFKTYDKAVLALYKQTNIWNTKNYLKAT